MYRSVYTVVQVFNNFSKNILKLFFQAQKEDDLSFVVIAKEGKVSLRASSMEKQAEWLRKCAAT